MKNFVDYTSRKCFASARVASPRLRNITHTRKISFSGLVIQITIFSNGITYLPTFFSNSDRDFNSENNNVSQV
jgi:hypothetical protein